MLLFVGTIISSAFFLFLVQPLLAKQILPWFGGTAAVWSVCLVFYQAVLLAGYVYAHLLARRLSPRRQALVHGAVLALSLAVLPIGLDGLPRPAPASAFPPLAILWLLLRAVGLPYFVLSTTSPLLQHWYTLVEPEGKAYRLFGWSNLSCAVALLSFPFAFEPRIPLSVLNRWWSAGFALVVVLLGATAWLTARRAQPRPEAIAAPASPWRMRLQWLGFSALGSALLLGVTSHLCQTVAPIPFLWTVPLLLYLLTFVACFEREWYTRKLGMPLAAAGLLAMSWSLVWLPARHLLGVGIPVFTLGFFLACFYCHGELALRKPETSRLTEFYILLAAGGVLGSVLVTFGAPLVFSGYFEFPLLMALCAAVILFSVYGRDWRLDAVAAAMAVLVLAPAWGVINSARTDRIAAGRNFYGSLRVVQEPARDGRPPLRQIIHGAINHGTQFVDPVWARKPTTYYGPRSGAGLWLRQPGGPRRIGIIGLGAGTLAAYGRPGDLIAFYEINPLVVEMARRDFTYLRDSAAQIDIRLGDGRLLLAAEPPQAYDLLVVDAFSGDSIPLHLLTRESFELYFRHLKPGGVLALHLSNLYLNLHPVVRSLAQSLGRHYVAVPNQDDPAEGTRTASWAVVGSREALDSFENVNQPNLALRVPPRPWTDDFSTLLAALL